MNPTEHIPQPRLWRLLLGFVTAPLVPAILLALEPVFTGTQKPDPTAIARDAFMALLYGGWPALLVLGVPLYFALRRRLRPRLVTLAAAGGIVAALPWLVLVLWPTPASHAEIGSCVTVNEGVRTWCGYLENLKLLAMIFALGAVGGATFWLCAVWRDPRYGNADSQGGG